MRCSLIYITGLCHVSTAVSARFTGALHTIPEGADSLPSSAVAPSGVSIQPASMPSPAVAPVVVPPAAPVVVPPAAPVVVPPAAPVVVPPAAPRRNPNPATTMGNIPELPGTIYSLTVTASAYITNPGPKINPPQNKDVTVICPKRENGEQYCIDYLASSNLTCMYPSPMEVKKCLDNSCINSDAGKLFEAAKKDKTYCKDFMEFDGRVCQGIDKQRCTCLEFPIQYVVGGYVQSGKAVPGGFAAAPLCKYPDTNYKRLGTGGIGGPAAPTRLPAAKNIPPPPVDAGSVPGASASGLMASGCLAFVLMIVVSFA